MVDPEQSSCHRSRFGSWVGLTRASVRIKMIIIIVLKPNLGVKPGQCVGHEWVDHLPGST
jgi:hypothetical protein